MAAIAAGTHDEHDPVYQAAREVVQALIETRWSLHAATVVVALRRLCETVDGHECLTHGR